MKRVAVVGSGPSSMACANYLNKNNIEVTIYEKEQKLGGLLRFGIPEFRLPKATLDISINKSLESGIKSKTNCTLGKNIFLKDLAKNFDAVYLGVGANIPKMIFSRDKVLSGNVLLEEISKQDIKKFEEKFAGKIIYVYGGGNVAMDAARTLKRLRAHQVTVLYRRDEAQMPANQKELTDVKNEEIEFMFLTSIKSVDEKLHCIKNQLITAEEESKNELLPTKENLKNVKDKSGKLSSKEKAESDKRKEDKRPVPKEIPGTEFELEYDYLVLANGAKADEEMIKGEGIELDQRGYIKVNEMQQANIENVFAGGDVIGEKATIANATLSGRRAGENILKFLKKN